MTLNTKLAATALAVVSLGVVGAADAATTAQTATKISIEADEDGFTGSLTSKKGKCETGRKVTLFRVKTKPGTKDLKIGSDTSNDDGEWTVETGKEGRFFAKTKANKSCKASTSTKVRSAS